MCVGHSIKFLLHRHKIVEELYFYFSLCVSVSVNEIPVERMHRVDNEIRYVT